MMTCECVSSVPKLKGTPHIGLESFIDPKLYIATIHELREALRDDALDHVLPERVVLLLDLDSAPTADGELLLSELALWCRGCLSDVDDTKLTLITMATFYRSPVQRITFRLDAAYRHGPWWRGRCS